MKTFFATFFLINSLIDCIPIDVIAGINPTVDHRVIFNLTDSFDDDEMVNSHPTTTSSNRKIPNDVELLESPTINNERQAMVPAVGPLIDMIFAVRFSYIHYQG